MRKQQQKENKSPTPRWASAQLATGLARPPSRPTWPHPTHSLIPSQPETLARSTTTPPRLLPRFPLDRDRPLHSPLMPRSSRSLPIRIGAQAPPRRRSAKAAAPPGLLRAPPLTSLDWIGAAPRCPPRRAPPVPATRLAPLAGTATPSPDLPLYVAVVPVLLPKGSTEPRRPSSLQHR